jgi:hypothetical protein
MTRLLAMIVLVTTLMVHVVHARSALGRPIGHANVDAGLHGDGLTTTDPTTNDDPHCICDDKSLCRALTSPLPTKEVFAFQVNANNWKHYDWSTLTTIALFDQDLLLLPELLCYAHARNVRLVFGANGPRPDQLTNATLRAILVQNEIDKALSMSSASLLFIKWVSSLVV